MVDLAKWIIVFGIILILIGGVVLVFSKIPWIGKLPGDIYIKRGNFTFFFPITTCILISILLSLIFFLFSRR